MNRKKKPTAAEIRSERGGLKALMKAICLSTGEEQQQQQQLECLETFRESKVFRFVPLGKTVNLFGWVV